MFRNVGPFVWLLFAGIAAGCSHPIEIYGEGDVLSLSGNRDCTLEQFQAEHPRCKSNFVIAAYEETYMAVPRPGWVFQGWRTYCAHNNTSDECQFSQPAAFVTSYWLRTVPPLRAAFLEDCPNPPNCFEILAPVLGAVTDSSIKIWQATKGSQRSNSSTARELTRGPPPPSQSTAPTGWVGTAHLTGLDSNTTYDYETRLNGTSYQIGTFDTLPPASWTGQTRFGSAADLNHLFHPYLALGHAAARKS